MSESDEIEEKIYVLQAALRRAQDYKESADGENYDLHMRLQSLQSEFEATRAIHAVQSAKSAAAEVAREGHLAAAEKEVVKLRRQLEEQKERSRQQRRAASADSPLLPPAHITVVERRAPSPQSHPVRNDPLAGISMHIRPPSTPPSRSQPGGGPEATHSPPRTAPRPGYLPCLRSPSCTPPRYRWARLRTLHDELNAAEWSPWPSLIPRHSLNEAVAALATSTPTTPPTPATAVPATVIPMTPPRASRSPPNAPVIATPSTSLRASPSPPATAAPATMPPSRASLFTPPAAPPAPGPASPPPATSPATPPPRLPRTPALALNSIRRSTRQQTPSKTKLEMDATVLLISRAKLAREPWAIGDGARRRRTKTAAM